jgi:hypothetical protein
VALSLEYIAGLLDADGSFSISISKNRYTNKKGISEPQFSFVVNFRQLEKADYILEAIQGRFGAGKIYKHGDRMLTWQTTTVQDTLRVCQEIEPYLFIKKEDCHKLINACILWIEAPRLKGPGRPRSIEVKQQIMDISTSMNEGQQKSTSRRNKDLRIDTTDWTHGTFTTTVEFII